MSFGCYSPEQTNLGLTDAVAISGRGKLQQLQDRGRFVLASTAPTAALPDASMRGHGSSMWRPRPGNPESSRQLPVPLALSKELCDNYHTAASSTWLVPPSAAPSTECLICPYSGQSLQATTYATQSHSGQSFQTTTYAPQSIPSVAIRPPPPPAYAPSLAPTPALQRCDEPPSLPPQCWAEVGTRSFPGTMVHTASSSRARSTDRKADVEDDKERRCDAGLALPPGARLAEQLAMSPGEVTVTVRNTFIDGGLDLKEFIQQGRQVHSCPGSRLASPRGSRLASASPRGHQCGGIGVSPRVSPRMSPRNSPEIVSSTASTVDTAEAIPDHESVASHLSTVQQPFRLHQAFTCVAAATMPPQRVTPQVLSLEEVLDLSPQMAVAPVETERPLGRLTTRLPQEDRYHSSRPQLGSPDLPSLGSIGHNARRCKPCAFATRDSCANGVNCNFCHLCGHGEKKRRRKEKRTLLAASTPFSSVRRASAPENLMLR